MYRRTKRGKRNHDAVPKQPPREMPHWDFHQARTSVLCMIVQMWGQPSRGSGKLRRLRRLGPIAWEPPAVLSESGGGPTTHQRFPAFHPVPNSPATRSRHQRNSNNSPSHPSTRTARQRLAESRITTTHPQRKPRLPLQKEARRLTNCYSRHPPRAGQGFPITHPTPRWAPMPTAKAGGPHLLASRGRISHGRQGPGGGATSCRSSTPPETVKRRVTASFSPPLLAVAGCCWLACCCCDSCW
ncbi:hypothetical protein B0I37DRAFT_230667 [Chaetomium sp. MPI-CAGE-AT-0009]|nr:hypothetical protein B0I37DRAFT_230667 [Chaetomium sp. MPI-CAGE-AT-0009]